MVCTVGTKQHVGKLQFANEDLYDVHVVTWFDGLAIELRYSYIEASPGCVEGKVVIENPPFS